MEYKGYEAVVEYDEENKILYGEVLHLTDVVTFQAECSADIEQAFHDSVDDYLEFCRENTVLLKSRITEKWPCACLPIYTVK
jgi:predicted HicB family RNase H-like nuclease